MKRTNIELDGGLVKRGMRATGIRTIKKLVDFALKELLRREQQKKILELRGNIHWKGNLSNIRRLRSTV